MEVVLVMVIGCGDSFGNGGEDDGCSTGDQDVWLSSI